MGYEWPDGAGRPLLGNIRWSYGRRRTETMLLHPAISALPISYLADYPVLLLMNLLRTVRHRAPKEFVGTSLQLTGSLP